MAATPIRIHGDDSTRRSSLTVTPEAGSVAAVRRADWSSRSWGIGISTVVHAVAFGLAALIVFRPGTADNPPHLESHWSVVESLAVNLETTDLQPTPTDEPDPTRDPGGSSFAELIDLAQAAESDEAALMREVTPSIIVTATNSPRRPLRSKPRKMGAWKQGEPNATVGQGNGEGNGIGDGKGFFGTIPEGKSVVFVVDNSRSMNHTDDSPAKTRYRRVKFELMKSIVEMPAESQFFVIFFCDVMLPMPATDLQPATPEMKDRYVRWIAQVETGGGPTEPRGAMQKALLLEPDIIYFLTDGEFERGVNTKLMSIHQPRTTIHTFAFGERLGEDVLKVVARKNRGEYKFIP